MNTFSFNMENMNLFESALPHGPPSLVRTYKAYCSYCGGMATSLDPLVRLLPCYFCEKVTVPLIQKHIRGFLVRLKLKKLRQKESIHRWFNVKNVNGSDFSHQIHSFL